MTDCGTVPGCPLTKSCGSRTIFDDHQTHARRRVVTAVDALEAWDNGFTARRNSRGAQDTRLLIGRTNGGREVTLVVRDLRNGNWLAFTAWDTKEADLAR